MREFAYEPTTRIHSKQHLFQNRRYVAFKIPSIPFLFADLVAKLKNKLDFLGIGVTKYPVCAQLGRVRKVDRSTIIVDSLNRLA